MKICFGGKMQEVRYQPDSLDEFRHRFLYDADNRLMEVLTSREGIIWDRDADYDYYDHGPVPRPQAFRDDVTKFRRLDLRMLLPRYA